MTPAQLYAARATLGQLWNKGRPLHASELGRALRLGGRDPGASIRDYERGIEKVGEGGGQNVVRVRLLGLSLSQRTSANSLDFVGRKL